MGLGNMEKFNFRKVLDQRATYRLSMNEDLISDLRNYILNNISESFKKSLEDSIQNKIKSFEKVVKESFLIYGGNLGRLSYHNLNYPLDKDLDLYRRLTIVVKEDKVYCGDLKTESIYGTYFTFNAEANLALSKILQEKSMLSEDSELKQIVKAFILERIDSLEKLYDFETKEDMLKYKLMFKYFIDDSFSFEDALKSKEYLPIYNHVKDIGLHLCEDENFYIYLLDRIKRSNGYQERKYLILSRAISNGVMSNKMAENVDKLTKKYRYKICHDLKEIDYKISRKRSYLQNIGVYKDIEKYYSSVCAKIIASSSSYIQTSILSECLTLSDKIFTLPILTKHLSSYSLSKLKEEIENARK